VDNGATPNERAEVIRRGLWGNVEEIALAEEALALLISDFDQLEAAVERYRINYGEAVTDPLTELRLRLQRGD
jgi:hypothetical protein